MEKKKVGILAECVCDLPKNVLSELGVGTLYFLVETENGIFTDTDEITTENVLFHIENGGKETKTSPPEPEVYRRAFEEQLEKYDDVLLVAISSRVSHSCENAGKAAELMGEAGKRVHIFDSGHLSTGLGFLVLRAAELANGGCTFEQILAELEELKPRVSTSFLTRNADYLYRNGRVSDKVKKVCGVLNIHPVLAMKNGEISLKTFFLCSYNAACRHYIRRMLKWNRNIDKGRCFITHAGCSVKRLRDITSQIEKYCRFEKIEVTSASAAVSGNCGPDTFGILFVKNR